jgi:hypothetical protein
LRRDDPRHPVGSTFNLDSIRAHLCPARAFSRSWIGDLAQERDYAELLGERTGVTTQFNLSNCSLALLRSGVLNPSVNHS